MFIKWRKKQHDHLNAEKAFDRIQHPFLIKTLNKLGMEGNFLNIKKGIYEKLISNISQWWKTESFLPKITNQTPLLFSTALEVLASVIRQEKQKLFKLKREE